MGVGCVAIDAGAYHQFALVGLAHIGMHLVGHDDRGHDRFYGFRYQGLQGVAFQGQANTRHGRQHRGMPRRYNAHQGRANITQGGPHALDPARLDIETRDLAILDDIHALFVGTPGIAPGDRIMAGHAGAALQGAADDGIADVGVQVQDRAQFGQLCRGHPFRVDAGQLVGIDAAH